MDVKRIGRAMLAVALLAGAACAAEPPPLDANDAPAIKALINDLGASDFAARERAQKTLETIPYSQIEILSKYADAVTDAEAKARLEEAIDRIEEVGITTAPPISLDIKGAPLPIVAQELSQAMKIPIDFSGSIRAGSDEQFSLQVKGQSYWDVLRQLNAQHALWISTRPDQIGKVGDAAHIQITRGVVVFANDPARPVAARPTEGAVQISVACDPRLKVLSLNVPQIDEARDELGQVLASAEDALMVREVKRVQAVGANPLVQSKSFIFPASDTGPKSISLKGSVTCVIGVSETKTEIADAGKHVGEAIALGDSKVTLRDISPAAAAGARAGLQLEIVPNDSKVAAPAAPIVKFTATGMSLSGGLSAGAGNRLVIDNEGSSGGMMIGAGGPSTGATHVTVTDATGKMVANYSVPRGLPVTSIHAVAGDFKEPLKFTFTVPTKTREVTIPFEFKNLPVK